MSHKFNLIFTNNGKKNMAQTPSLPPSRPMPSLLPLMQNRTQNTPTMARNLTVINFSDLKSTSCNSCGS